LQKRFIPKTGAGAGNSAGQSSLPIPSGDEYLPKITTPKSTGLAPMLPAPQMQQLPQYQSGNSGHMGGSAGGYLPQMKSIGGITKNPVARILNDEMIKRGYTPQARLSMLGDIGRENGWNANTIFDGHRDPASFTNGHGDIRNVGIISWNGTRRAALLSHLKKDGVKVSPNGQVAPSEKALRSMVGFMDGEMKSGKWGNQWAAMRNPNLSTQQVSGKLQDYILYSEKPRYNSPDSMFNVANNRKWAEKAYGLVSTTGGGNAASTLPQFNGSKAQQMMRMRQIPVSKGRGGNGSVPKSVRAGGGTSSPSTVQRTPPPQMNDGVAEMTALQKMNNVQAKAYAPVARANVAYQNKSAVNAFKRDEQAGLTRQHTNTMNDISDQALYGRSAAAGELYTTQNQSSGIRANAGLQSQYIQYQGGMQRAGIGYHTSKNVADMSFERDFRVAESQKNISIEAARLNAMSNIIQSVGSSVGHQLGEAFEKFNRF
jgi:hypothetical protein